MTEQQTQAVHALLTLVQLEKRLRWAQPDEAAFIAVNELHRLIPYKQAVLFMWPTGALPLLTARAVSGLSEADQDSPLVRRLSSFIKALADDLPKAPISYRGDDSRFDARDETAQAFASSDTVILVPLDLHDETARAVLLMVRQQPLTAAEAALLEKAGDAIAGALGRDHGRKAGWRHMIAGSRLRTRVLLAGIALLLAFPVRASVLAPAEVVAQEPQVIRSPLQGVIAQVHVSPNEDVAKGDVMVSFDESELKAKYESSRQALLAVQAEMRQTGMQAVMDSEARARLASIEGRLAQQRVNVDYAQSQLTRGQVLAPSAGVAIFDNTYEWIGRPVSIGEKIMLLADPARTHLEIRLAVADAIDLPRDAKVLYFSNAAPHRPIDARLSMMGYRASEDERKILSYRFEAAWDSQEGLPRIGSSGTAKIYGGYRPLVWHILRKPFAALRQFTGW